MSVIFSVNVIANLTNHTGIEMTGDSELISSRDVKDKDIMYVHRSF